MFPFFLPHVEGVSGLPLVEGLPWDKNATGGSAGVGTLRSSTGGRRGRRSQRGDSNRIIKNKYTAVKGIS